MKRAACFALVVAAGFPVSSRAASTGDVPLAMNREGPLGNRYVRSVDARFPPVRAMASTPDGFFWLASEDGLWRFDGTHFDLLTDGFGDPAGARVLMVGHDGALWVATGNARLTVPPENGGKAVTWRGAQPGLLQRKDGRLQMAPVFSRLPSPWVWALAEDKDGGLWVGTERGLYNESSRGSAQLFDQSHGLPADLITALATTPGKVWVGTVGGLALIENGKVRVVLPKVAVRAIVLRPSGELLVGSVDGAWILDSNGEVLRRIDSWGITALFATEDRGIWVGDGEGLWLLDEFTGTYGAKQKQFAGVAAIGRDREDGLWVWSNVSGLARMGPAPVRSAPDLLGKAALSVLAARDGSLWVVTPQGLARLGDGKELKFFPRGRELGWAPRSMAEAGNGDLWITGDNLARVRNNEVRAFRALKSGRKVSPIQALVLRNGDLVVSWVGGGLSRFANGNPDAEEDFIDGTSGICPGQIGPMLEDAEGILWLGTMDAGVGRLDRKSGKGACLTAKNGLAGNEIAALYARKGGVLVGFAQPVGLSLIQGNGATAVPLPDPVRRRRIFGINEHNGRTWLTSDTGVFVSTGESDPGWQQLGIEDGLPSNTCMAWFQPSIARTADGRLWVPTLTGLGVIESDLPLHRPMPAIFIEEIKVAGVALPGRTQALLSPGSASLEVRVAAPSFSRTNELVFETWLQGLESGWNNRGSSRDTIFSGLAPGRYVFRARVFNRFTGARGDAVTLPVLVEPWWWQRMVVRMGAVLGLVAMLTLAFVLRGRRLRARYQAIADERSRIARDLHDGLAQGFTSIALYVDSAILELQKEPSGAQPQSNRPVEILGATKSIIDQCHTEVRRAVFNLRAQQEHKVSVADGLRRVADEARRTQGIDVKLVIRGEPPESSSGARLEHELPMVVQEAISNAVQHGQARRISVALEIGAQETVLRIHDDGTGISDAALAARGRPDGGFGLVGMSERATRVGGTLDVRRGDSGGTDVVLRIPNTAS